MNEKIIAEISEVRLDSYLAEKLNLTRAAVSKLVEDGGVSLGGKVLKKNHKIREGEEYTITLPEPKELSATPEDIPLDVVYSDADLMVINKAVGMVCHPAAGNWEGTLVNALLFHLKGELSSINGVLRPGIVHRLDKNTSGLMLVAKTDFAHNFLAEELSKHAIIREYEAVICGHLKESKGRIELPIGRHKRDRIKMAVNYENGKQAITNFEVLCEYEGYSHIRLRLETGRTHQIRVHMQSMGHPLLGDVTYGGNNPFHLPGQCLHSRNIEFIHPRTGDKLRFETDLPDYFKTVLSKLKER